MILWECRFAGAQEGVFGGTITPTGTLNLREFVDLGSGPINDLNHSPADNRVYVVTTNTGVHAVEDDGSTFSLFLDVVAGVATTGRSLNMQGSHSGIRSIAFHPEYATNGKFYTSIMETKGAGSGPLLGTSPSFQNAESVLVEWTTNLTTGVVDLNSYREVLRVGLPVYDHTIKRIRFNEYAEPGDEDYGLLYVAHGDAGTQSGGTGQVGTEALGKLLRINPLDPDGPGGAAYSVPTENPFTTDPTILDEVYALGFRNPHNFDWQKDSSGTPHLVLADIGQGAAEELNIVEAGKNYGWRSREGTRVNTGGGAGDPLGPGMTHTAGFTFPVAQFGHSPGLNAIFGGYVVPYGPNAGEYIFGNFSNTRIFHVTMDALVSQVTEGNSEDLTQEWIEEYEFVTEDGAPSSWAALVGHSRSDARMGRGPDGTIYLTNKRNGKVFIVMTPGDFDADYDVDGSDFMDWQRRFSTSFSGTELPAWQRYYGEVNTVAASAAIPEPATTVLIASALLLATGRRRSSP